ncbi:MAG: hypothetical protein RL211_2120, partial [Pseudomonadota bacterium]
MCRDQSYTFSVKAPLWGDISQNFQRERVHMSKAYTSVWSSVLEKALLNAPGQTVLPDRGQPAHRRRRQPLRKTAEPLVLEQRIVFDAAMAATLDHAQDQDQNLEPIWRALEEIQLPAVAELAAAREVIFIDASVANIASLLPAGTGNVYLLQAGQDGLVQMATIMSQMHNVDAVHIISHGGTGSLQLGSATLTQSGMEQGYAQEMAQIRGALSGGADVLLYGCDVAQGSAGASFISALSSQLSADVAASTNATGHVSLGGDWVLEAATGAIEATTLVATGYRSVLWDSQQTGVAYYGGGATTLTAAPSLGALGSASDMQAGGGVSITNHVDPASGGQGQGTVFLVGNVGSTSYGQAVTNNDYIYATVTVNPADFEIRLSQFTFNQRLVNESSASVVVALYNPDNEALTQLTNAGALDGATATTSLTVISMPSMPAVDAANALIDYQIRWYFYTGGGTTTVYLDNPVVSLQANTAPTATNDTGTATEQGVAAGANATGNVLTNDVDADSAGTFAVSAVRTGAVEGSGTAGTVGSALSGTYGALTLNADGSYTYVVNNSNAAVNALQAGQTLTETFNYTLRTGPLGGYQSDAATLAITINGANDAPVDANETASVAEDSTLTTSAGTGLLANSTDVDGGAPVITGYTIAGVVGTQAVGSAVTIANRGSITINADGSYSFTPVANYTGTVPVITYTVSDGAGGTDTSTLSLSVTAVNDAPVVDLNSGEVGQEMVINGGFSSATGWTASGGWLVGSPYFNASISTDTGTYTLSSATLTGWDTGLSSNGATQLAMDLAWGNGIGAMGVSPASTLTVRVGGVSYATVTTATGTGGSANIVYLNGATGNLATVPVGTTTPSAWVIDLPTTVSATGALVFSFTGGGSGGDDFVIDNVSALTRVDGTAGSNFSTTYTENGAAVSISDIDNTVRDVDDTNMESATVLLTNSATGDRFLVNGSSLASGTLAGGITWTRTDTQVTFSGSASESAYADAIRAVQFENTTEAPLAGNRTVTVIVSDGDTNSNTATSTIAVTAVNDAPVDDNETASVTEDTPLVVAAASGLLANSTDVDGGTPVIS